MKLHREKLEENLSATEVIDYLWQFEILNDEVRQDIMSQPTPLSMNKALVDKLLHLKPWEFVLFIQFLDNTGQEHIANLLGERGKTSYEFHLLFNMIFCIHHCKPTKHS